MGVISTRMHHVNNAQAYVAVNVSQSDDLKRVKQIFEVSYKTGRRGLTCKTLDFCK